MSLATCFVPNQGRTQRPRNVKCPLQPLVCDILRLAGFFYVLLSAYKCNRTRKALETIHTADECGTFFILTSCVGSCLVLSCLEIQMPAPTARKSLKPPYILSTLAFRRVQKTLLTQMLPQKLFIVEFSILLP